ncbi:hypothetical protein THAOC_14052 [Thalassiosira oceanica]|uniref:HCP-like protein n=1 Tax=Thalassiosira oceanica TaxID=159749 RepID=K0SVZ2_THAOC|nr:hypothetical protein THAOC_14052 [Thalassiosira oceanica]|eukprot:EJK65131.1 hypothetical protein THAOC_14052 [Thalassiosira oceanica]
MIQNRVKANDPLAIHHLGLCYRDGNHGLEKDMPRAVELFEQAAELGLKEAHLKLGYMFDETIAYDGVDNDMSKAIEHYEFAAKQGYVIARHNLGAINYNMGNYGLARKHWMISAKLGFKESLDDIKDMYMEGMALKSDYAEAMHGYHNANKEMGSPDMESTREGKDRKGELSGISRVTQFSRRGRGSHSLTLNKAQFGSKTLEINAMHVFGIVG